MTPDLTRDGLRVLQNRMLAAVVEAPTPSALLSVQRDLVEGARRLLDALHTEYLGGNTRPEVLDAYAEVATFYRDAQEALTRYEHQPLTISRQQRSVGYLLR